VTALEKEKQSPTTTTNPTTMVHGFDSFQGLPVAWENGQRDDKGETKFGPGAFNVGGQQPEMNLLQNTLNLAKHGKNRDGKKIIPNNDNDDDTTTPRTTTNNNDDHHYNNLANNVAFHKGWFEDGTVSDFLDENMEPMAFIHADADLYESTFVFLDEICKRKLLKRKSVVSYKNSSCVCRCASVYEEKKRKTRSMHVRYLSLLLTL
jgi:hypothetical protein